MRGAIPLGLMVIALAAGLRPAAAEEGCDAFKWSIAKERAALTAEGLPMLATGGTYPALGTGVTVALAPQAGVAYRVPPARAPKSNPAYGAEIAADTPGGAVQVTLSDDAWVDLVQGGAVLRSTAFSGKAGCAGVRKSVRFMVAPGPLTIGISDSPVASIRLDVTPAE